MQRNAAVPAFASPKVSVELKLSFADALLFSRLFFGAELWHDGGVYTATKATNAMYMRVLRRVCDESRYGAPDCLTDLQVRKKLGVMSISCKLRIRRLSYLSQLAENASAPLLAMLSTRDGKGNLLPWCQTIVHDLQYMYY